MAPHSDGSQSDDTWLFRDCTTIHNHPHKCQLGEARNKEEGVPAGGKTDNEEEEEGKKEEEEKEDKRLSKKNRVSEDRAVIQS